jgi:hypothetical protein
MTPRGIRNNNPLNIRIGNAWLGEVAIPTDKEFEQFTSLRWGLRAGFLLLKRYINRYHLNSIRLIVSRWAPSSENNTEAYIKRVSALTGFDADEVITFESKMQMCALVEAMCLVECGCQVDCNEIREAYELAKSW